MIATHWAALGAAIIFSGGCATVTGRADAVPDAAAAMRIGLANRHQTDSAAQSVMHAELRNGVWHAWQPGLNCENLVSDIDAATGRTDGCGVCVAL